MSPAPSEPKPRKLPRNFGWHLGTASASWLLLGFLFLPIFALGATLSWDQFYEGITHPLVWPALKLTLLTTTISLLVVVLFGTPLAWMLARSTPTRFSRMIETLVRLPAVLPPAVAGVALLLAFGRMGLVGQWLDWGIPFTTKAVILAEIFVAAPYFLQSAIAAFRSMDESLITVARSLGAGPARIFFRIALPIAMTSLISGSAMAWARALGEFGATLMFAGNLSGETQTLTLAIYTTYESDVAAAQAISLVLVAVAFTLLYFLTIKTEAPRKGAY